MRKINQETTGEALEAAVEQPEDAVEGVDGNMEWMSEFSVWIAEEDFRGVVFDVEHMRMGGKDNWSVLIRHTQMENAEGAGVKSVSNVVGNRIAFYSVSPLDMMRYMSWTSAELTDASRESALRSHGTMKNFAKLVELTA